MLMVKLHIGGADSFVNLGEAIGISASQAHVASKRTIASGLVRPDLTVRRAALLDTLIALKYFMPAERGGEVRGIPTAHAAPPLVSHILDREGMIPVWPHPTGNARGLACSPIYKTAPDAALRDPELYEYLALIDSLRIGNVREQNFAKQALEMRLGAT